MSPLAYISFIAALSVAVAAYLHTHAQRMVRDAADDRWAEDTVTWFQAMKETAR